MDTLFGMESVLQKLQGEIDAFEQENGEAAQMPSRFNDPPTQLAKRRYVLNMLQRERARRKADTEQGDPGSRASEGG